MDSDPGGPKTCASGSGSGSPILLMSHMFLASYYADMCCQDSAATLKLNGRCDFVMAEVLKLLRLVFPTTYLLYELTTAYGYRYLIGRSTTHVQELSFMHLTVSY
jgi:hypothetical protein